MFIEKLFCIILNPNVSTLISDDISIATRHMSVKLLMTDVLQLEVSREGNK